MKKTDKIEFTRIGDEVHQVSISDYKLATLHTFMENFSGLGETDLENLRWRLHAMVRGELCVEGISKEDIGHWLHVLEFFNTALLIAGTYSEFAEEMYETLGKYAQSDYGTRKVEKAA